jgi:hypothetical protein
VSGELPDRGGVFAAFAAGLDAMKDTDDYLKVHGGHYLVLPQAAVSGSMEYLLPGAGTVGAGVAAARVSAGLLRSLGRAVTRAIEAVARAQRRTGLCFPAGTPVLMADGSTKPIEEVEVGDLVWSDDPGDGEAASGRRVTAHLRNWTERLVHVAVDQDGDGDADGEVRATGEHPFWTVGRGWVEAQHLQPGDVLQSPDGTAPVVTCAQSVLTTCDTFNLTIAETHTYFALAGELPVLVHNADLVPPYFGGAYNQLGSVYGLVERHHIPPASIIPFRPERAPAIQMAYTDHIHTRSWGNSAPAQAYREGLRRMWNQGRARSVFAKEIWDIRRVAGSRYNDAIQEVLAYARAQGMLMPPCR